MGTGRGRRMAAVCITGVCSLLFAAPALAADGDLDPTFAGDGRAVVDFSPFATFFFDEHANDVIAQDDGKILVAGSGQELVFEPGFPPLAESEVILARLNSDGSLDTSFSGDGRVVTETGVSDFANAVAAGPGGTYVVAGSAFDQSTAEGSLLLARYEADGDLDSTFSGDGLLKETFGLTAPVAHDVAVQDDGKIVIAGEATVGGTSRFLIARFEPDGDADASFGSGGVATAAIGSSSAGEGLVIDEDGNLVVAGRAVSGPMSFALARFQPDGDLDPSFSGDGMTTTDFGAASQANAVQIQSDGRIVAAGSTDLAGGDLAIARYLDDGGPDASFSADGRSTTGTGVADRGADLALQADGRAVVSGNANGDNLVARWTTDGDLDRTFSGDAIATTETGNGGEPAGEAVAIQDDGKIVSAGGNFNDVELVRHLVDVDPPETTIDGGPAEGSSSADGTPEFSFSSDEVASEFECSIDGAAFEDCESPATIGPLASGPHTFRVAAVDPSGGTDPTPAQRNFTIASADATPVDDQATVLEDSADNPIDVLANDSDDDPLAVTAVGQPDHGETEITGGGSGVAYTPDPDYCNDPGGPADDTFSYHANDIEATVDVTVTCTDDPITAVPDSAGATEDSQATIDVRANDTNPDGGEFAVTAVGDAANGSTEIVNDGDDVRYTPDGDHCGADSFDYTISGGSTATVSVSVGCVDDAPDAVGDSYTRNEEFSANLEVRANDTDIDGGPMTVVDVTDPPGGNAQIWNGGDEIRYTPDSNYCNDPGNPGENTFTYTLNGGAQATVTMTVTCVDDIPMAAPDTASLDEDAPTTIDVLANDTDVDGGPMSVHSFTEEPSHGTAQVTNGGEDVRYTPDGDYCGPDTFRYRLNDDSSTFSAARVDVTVACLDDGPIAVGDTATTVEDTSVTVDVRANDTEDVDGGPRTIIGKADGAQGAVEITNGGDDVRYTPTADFCGADSFTYSLNGGSTARVDVTVNCVDDPPPPDPAPGDPPANEGCDQARADLAAAERGLNRAADKVRAAKKRLKKANGEAQTKAAKRKLKKAKGKLADAKDAVAAAEDAVSTAC